MKKPIDFDKLNHALGEALTAFPEEHHGMTERDLKLKVRVLNLKIAVTKRMMARKQKSPS